MTRKKDWLEPGSLKLLNTTKSSDLDISWSSSSESEEDLHYNRRKRIRPNCNLDGFRKFNSLKDEGIVPRHVMDNFMDSPIIGKNLVRELSPTFNKNSDDDLEKSPVIGKNLKPVNWKKRKKRQELNFESLGNAFKYHKGNDAKEEFNISTYSSSDISQTQSLRSQIRNISNFTETSQAHIDNHEISRISQISNDIFSQYSQPVTIDFAATQTSIQGKEEVIISEYSSSHKSHSSVINEISGDNFDPSKSSSANSDATSSGNGMSLINKTPKRQRFKKGGLAKQLQKCLKNKQASISIWKHELYLNNANFCNDFLYFQVCTTFIEFGNLLFECELMKDIGNSDCDSKCIVVSNNLIEQTSTCPKYLKLYKPYSTSNLKYFNKEVRCYYNCCKIIFVDS